MPQYVFNRHLQATAWSALKHKLNVNYRGGSGHFFPRSAIVSVFFGENVGYEKSGMRPALVVSLDVNNKTNGNVVVVPLTKIQNKQRGLLNTQYLLLSSKYKLKFDSVVQCEDIRVVSKARLGDVIDFVDPADMKQIDKRLKYLLSL